MARNSREVETQGFPTVLDIDAFGKAAAEREKAFAQTEVAENPNDSRLNNFATKVASEGCSLLENRDVDAAAGEQEAKHDPAGPAPTTITWGFRM